MPAIVLPSQIKHADAGVVLALIRSGVRAAPGDAGVDIVVDAGAVSQFDSTALAVLLEAQREALAAGRKLVVQGLPEGLARLAKVYGVDELLSPT